MQLARSEGTKEYLQGLSLTTKMTAMAIYDNQSAEGTGGLGIIRGIKVGETE